MRLATNRRASRGAFTIIEILLAIGILMGVILAIYSSWSAIMRGTDVGIRAANDAQRTRMAVRLVEQSLSSVVMFSQNIAYYGFECDNSGDFSYVSFAAHLPEDFPGGGRFSGQPFRRITFAVEEGQGGNALVMSQSPILELVENEDDIYSMILSKEVNTFELEFWDAQLEDWTYDWVQTNSIPPLVRFSVGFGPPPRTSFEKASVVSKAVAISSIVVQPEFQLPQLAGGGRGVGVGAGGVGGPGNPSGAGGIGGNSAAAAAAAAAGKGFSGGQKGFGSGNGFNSAGGPGFSGGGNSFSGGPGRSGGVGRSSGRQGGPGFGGGGGPGFGGQGLGGGGRAPGGGGRR